MGDYRVMITDSSNLLRNMILTGGTEPHDVTLAQGQIYSAANFGYARASMALTKSANLSSLETPGGDVLYTVALTNTGPIDITLNTLLDDKFGILANRGSCALPQMISAGAAYSCSFTGTVTGSAGEAHINVVVARARDSEGNPLSAADFWRVRITSPSVSPTPPTPAIPTMSETGRIILFLFMFAIALLVYRRKYYQ